MDFELKRTAFWSINREHGWPRLDSSERLSLIFETQREIARAGNDLQSVMQLVAERSQAITGADGAMVNLIDGDMLHTRCGERDRRRRCSTRAARSRQSSPGTPSRAASRC